MSSRPLSQILRPALLWTAIAVNSVVALAIPVVVAWAAWQVVEVAVDYSHQRGDISDLWFPLVAAAFVLTGLYLVVGYWRVGRGRATARSTVGLWALSLGYNALILLLALGLARPLNVISGWALFMTVLSGYELTRAVRAGPQNPPLQADVGRERSRHVRP